MQINRLTPIPMKMNKMAMARSSGDENPFNTVYLAGFDLCKHDAEINSALGYYFRCENALLTAGRVDGKAIKTNGIYPALEYSSSANGYVSSYASTALGFAFRYNTSQTIILFAQIARKRENAPLSGWRNIDETVETIEQNDIYTMFIVKDNAIWKVSKFKGEQKNETKLRGINKNIWNYIEFRYSATTSTQYWQENSIYLNGELLLKEAETKGVHYIKHVIAACADKIEFDDFYYALNLGNYFKVEEIYGSAKIGALTLQTPISTGAVFGSSDINTALSDSDAATGVKLKTGENIEWQKVPKQDTPVNCVVRAKSLEGGTLNFRGPNSNLAVAVNDSDSFKIARNFRLVGSDNYIVVESK